MLTSDQLKIDMNVGMVAVLNTSCGASATINFFDGTLPTFTTDPDSGSVLVQFPLANPPWTAGGAFSNSLNGTPIVETAAATGVATYWRLKDTGGVVIAQGTIATSGADLNMDDTSITLGDSVSLDLMAFLTSIGDV